MNDLILNIVLRDASASKNKLVLGLEFFLFGTKNGKEKFVGWDAIYGGYGVATTLKIVHSL